MCLLNASVANAFQATVSRLELLTPSDTTQNITQTGYYRITVRGAEGGNSYNGRASGGSGATVAATFLLQAGDVLKVVTGIAGSNGATGYGVSAAGGGGGGSAVILTRNGVSTLLIVAGAGGGASSLTNGRAGISAQGIAGGGKTESSAGGGGGFNANGAEGALSTGGRAGTLSGGGVGGCCAGVGGYGFGGGGGGSGVGSGGGGGGYGGGDAGGTGGTSFVDASGINTTRTDGTMGAGKNQNGSVSIAATTAALMSISGRVLIRANRGLMNAVVYLTDAEGNTYAARTNSFGYYHFQDIQAGQTVTLVVVSKRYQFSSQILNLNEEFSGVNFLAEQ